jgi:hypothetical protein
MAKTAELTATFTASGAGFTFNRVYGVIGTVSGGVTTWNTNISYLWAETESIGLSPGVSRPYKVVFLSDNKTSSPL